MGEKSKQTPGTLERIKQTFRKQSTLAGSGLEILSESPPRAEVRRSLTVSGPIARKKMSRRSSQADEVVTSPNRRSTFYEFEDVTRPVCHPADFAPLELQGKTMNQVLRMLKAVSVSRKYVDSDGNLNKCGCHCVSTLIDIAF